MKGTLLLNQNQSVTGGLRPSTVYFGDSEHNFVLIADGLFFFETQGKCFLCIPAPWMRAGYVRLALFNGPYPLKPH